MPTLSDGAKPFLRDGCENIGRRSKRSALLASAERLVLMRSARHFFEWNHASARALYRLLAGSLVGDQGRAGKGRGLVKLCFGSRLELT